MIVLKKTILLLSLLLLILGSCTNEPKPPPTPVPPKSTLPLEMLIGTWEVSDAVRNGKKTDALEGIYFTFTEDEKLTTNFNLSVEERNFSYRMKGDTIITLSDPEHPYLIESLEEKGLILRTRMERFLFRLNLIKKEDLPAESEEEI